MKNIRKKVRFHFNLKSKHLLVIMTLFCGSCIVATAASGTTSAPLQNVAGFLVVPFEKGISGVSNMFGDVKNSLRDKQDVPSFRPGDTVEVKVWVVEGSKKRLQQEKNHG